MDKQGSQTLIDAKGMSSQKANQRRKDIKKSGGDGI